jgi:hypothetical protein
VGLQAGEGGAEGGGEHAMHAHSASIVPPPRPSFSCENEPASPVPDRSRGCPLVHSRAFGRNFRILRLVVRAKCEGSTTLDSGHDESLPQLGWEIAGVCSGW